jgi:hypothetical protein
MTKGVSNLITWDLRAGGILSSGDRVIGRTENSNGHRFTQMSADHTRRKMEHLNTQDLSLICVFLA